MKVLSLFKSRAVLFVMVAALLPVVFGFQGCPRNNSNQSSNSQPDTRTAIQKVAPYVENVLKWSDRAVPVLQANGIGTTKLEKFNKIGQDLLPALENSSPDAIEQISGFLNAFDDVIEDANLIKNPRTKTIVMVALAFVDDALHSLANKVIKVAQTEPAYSRYVTSWAPQQTRDAAATIKAFAKKPRLRCRDAVTGRFQKMEVCKARPESTVIERVKK